MNKRIYVRISICFLVIAMCAYVCFCISSYLFIINRCRFVWNGALNESIKKNIIDDLQKKFLYKPFCTVTLQEAQQSFSFLKDLHIWYKHSGSLHCVLHVYKPIARINNNFIMVENGNLYATNFFDEELQHFLPCIEILPGDFTTLLGFCKNYIASIWQPFFEQFTITLVDHTRFELHDKKNPNVVCVVASQIQCNEGLLCRYEAIKKQLSMQKLFAKKSWYIDMRFNNQIVVTQKNVGST